MQIELPISKSIANRLLILQAIHGDELMPVSATFPDDVLLLHRALTIFTTHSSHCERPIGGTPSDSEASDNRIAEVNLGNCGTAMRFLTAYCAQLDGQTTILDGVERMHHRPIGQLVDALREIGAQIEYLGEEGFPPLRITGCALDKHKIVQIDNPLSTQFISALLLIGANVQTNSTSPYINITRTIIEQFTRRISSRSQGVDCERKVVENNVGGVVGLNNLESDWSSAAFWYEYIAIHSGKIHLPGLFRDSIQGDKVVADIFAQLGVQTQYTTEGIIIQSITNSSQSERPIGGTPSDSLKKASLSKILSWDFGNCPDLYPAVALTCEKLGIQLDATGIDSLPLKESDRLRAVREHRVDADHRMAMALLVADYPIDDTDCISKSYPQFLEQFNALHKVTPDAHHNSSTLSIVVPRRGINDEGKGKKHALYRLISEAQTEYIWMMDDDVLHPSIINEYNERSTAQRSTVSIANDLQHSDLLILPLRMESENERPSLLERLQTAEYAAIQQLTIESAQKGKAVMCSGANLIVRRDRWLESYPDLHPEIPSGDDMFLLESFKRRGLKVAVLDDPQFEAIVRPHTSWRAFLHQRMRWAGKAPKYTDKDIIRCGALVVLTNLLQLLCPLVLLFKFPIEYQLIKKRDASVSLFTALVLAVFYPFYLFTSLIGGVFRRQW